MKTPKLPIKATSVWSCVEHPETAMTFEEMLAHAREVHGLDLKGKMLHATSNPRNKSDYMAMQ